MSNSSSASAAAAAAAAFNLCSGAGICTSSSPSLVAAFPFALQACGAPASSRDIKPSPSALVSMPALSLVGAGCNDQPPIALFTPPAPLVQQQHQQSSLSAGAAASFVLGGGPVVGGNGSGMRAFGAGGGQSQNAAAWIHGGTHNTSMAGPGESAS